MSWKLGYQLRIILTRKIPITGLALGSNTIQILNLASLSVSKSKENTETVMCSITPLCFPYLCAQCLVYMRYTSDFPRYIKGVSFTYQFYVYYHDPRGQQTTCLSWDIITYQLHCRLYLRTVNICALLHPLQVI